MRARNATVDDLSAVFGNLAQRMSSEYKAAGADTEQAKDAFLRNLKEGRGHTLLQGEEPVAIVTWEEEDGAVQTSFAAHETFFSASTVRFCKKHIRDIQRLCGNLPVRSCSWSDRQDVQRWFEIIGFRKIEDGDGYRLFELSSFPAIRMPSNND